MKTDKYIIDVEIRGQEDVNELRRLLDYYKHYGMEEPDLSQFGTVRLMELDGELLFRRWMASDFFSELMYSGIRISFRRVVD